MKKLCVLATVPALILVVLLAGCDEGGSGGLSGDAAEEAAYASLGSGYISAQLIDQALDDAIYGAGAVGCLIVSGTLTVSGSGSVYTFSACGLDCDDDDVVDVTLNGEFTVTANGTTTVTFDELNMYGSPPGMSGILDATVSGTLVIATTEFTASLTVSGVTGGDLVVELAIIASGGEPQSIESATINGTDYTDLFNEVLSEMMS